MNDIPMRASVVPPSIPLMFRSSIYGSLIGMMPGLGSSVACFVAYGEEKRKAKTKVNGAQVLLKELQHRNLPTTLYRALP